MGELKKNYLQFVFLRAHAPTDKRSKRPKNLTCKSIMLLGSSMVEHSAVNRVVAGSSPARGAKFFTTLFIININLAASIEVKPFFLAQKR